MPVVQLPQRRAMAPYSTHGEGISKILGSRLAPADLERLPKGGPSAEFARNLLLNSRIEDDRLTRSLSSELGGKTAAEGIAASLHSTAEYATGMRFVPEEGGKEADVKALLLYCGGPLYRAFMLTNASLSSFWWEQGGGAFCEHMSAIQSLKVSGDPGDYKYLYLVPKGVAPLLTALCQKNAAGAAKAAKELVREAMRGHLDSGTDLPAPMPKPQPKDSFEEFLQRKKPEQAPAPKAIPHAAPSPKPEMSAQALVNTLGITEEQLKEARQVKIDNPDAMELFGGYEVQLESGDPQVDGMRLIVTSRHPSTIVDAGADRIGSIDPSRCLPRKIINKGKERKLYYVLVTGGEGLENTGRLSGLFGEGPKIDILGLDEAQEPAPAAELMPDKARAPEQEKPEGPAPASRWIPDELLTETQLAVRTAARGVYGGKVEIEAETFCRNGEIALLVNSDGKHFIVTDTKDIYEALKGLSEEISSEGRDVRFHQTLTAMGTRRIALKSGETLAVHIRSVVVRDASQNDTLEMVPRRILDAAAAAPVEDPASTQRREQTCGLLKSAVLHVPERYLSGEAGDMEFTEMSDLLDSLPSTITEVGAEQRPGGWFLTLKARDGDEYALFRFPRNPAGLSENVLGQYGAVFTAKGYPNVSYLLIRRQFLSARLTDLLLSEWAA